MNSGSMKIICRMLIVLMVMLPLQTVQAGMIGTDQAVNAAQAQAARGEVNSLLSRTEIAGQLQALGLTAENAKDRVAALTDAEAIKLAGQIDSLPAGAGPQLVALVVILLLVFVVLSIQKK
jgi:hypothetical protein